LIEKNEDLIKQLILQQLNHKLVKLDDHKCNYASMSFTIN